MTIPRISLQATVGALVALTAVSATAQTRPAAPPVRNVTDTYFGSNRYRMVPGNGTFRIKEKRCLLDSEGLRAQGRVSIIL